MPRFGPRSTASTRPKAPAPKPPAVKAHGGGGGLAPAPQAPRPRGTPAQGGAVLRRGTFQPDNRKQQAQLRADAGAEGNRLARVRRAQQLHLRAQKLYERGQHVQALTLNGHARQMAGLPSFEGAGVVGKAIEQTAKDLGQAAYYTPGGLYATGKAGVAAAKGNPKPLEKIGKQVVKGTEESFTHPLRHPGYTALNALALASAGAGAVSRVGAAGEALRSGEGVGAAIARPGFKGGSLLHKNPPGEINLPGGAQALEPDNPLLRPLKRARMKRVAKAIEQGRELPGPSAVRKHAGAQNVVGRELRAREQVQADIAQAPVEAMKARVKKLTPQENTALRVIATEGHHALRNPEETIGRHIQTHLENAEQGIAPKLNREIATDLKAALPVLKAKPPEFMRAVASARKISKRSEGELVGGERLSQEAADARRAKIAQVYGHPAEGAPKGSFYFPTGERFKFPTKPLKGGAVSRRPSPVGLGPVDASRYLQGTTKRFTGKGLKTGVVQRPGEAIASRATGTAKLASAERVHASLLKMATPERRGEFDIPIRATRQISQADRRKVAAALEEAQTGDKTALVRSENAIKDAIAPREGEQAVYVDRRYLKEITGGTASKVAKAGAIFNKPFRLGGVYLRPAYVATNRPQNFLMRHLQQGLRTKKPIRGTVGHMRHSLGEELTAKIDAASGQTRTEAFTPQGFTKRSEQKITGAISNATDRSERFLAVLARAHEKGYRSEADLRRLFADQAPEKVVNDRVAISRRASKDMVDFRSVTPGEHEISDLIYFYPWLSRATGWSGRFVANHPIKSAALASTAPIGQQEQRKALGPVPAWLKGFIPTGKGLVNPASVNTFETPAQIGQYLANPTGPQANSFGEEFGTPVVQALTTPPSQWGKKALQSQALGLMAERFGLIGKTPKTFPKTGAGPALGPFTFGGLYPRSADKAAIAKQAVAELAPVDRIKTRHSDYAKKILQGAIKTGLLPKGSQKLTPQLQRALKIRTARYVNREKMGAKDTRSRFEADVRFLEQRKIVTPAKADRAVKWAKGEKRDYLVEKELRHLSDWYFDDLYGHALADARQKLRDKGYDLPRLP